MPLARRPPRSRTRSRRRIRHSAARAHYSEGGARFACAFEWRIGAPARPFAGEAKRRSNRGTGEGACPPLDDDMKYAAVAVFLLFTACPHSHEDYSQNAPSKTSTSTSPTLHSRLDPSAPQRTALNPAGAPAANRTVNVELTEYAIQIPQTLNAVRCGA